MDNVQYGQMYGQMMALMSALRDIKQAIDQHTAVMERIAQTLEASRKTLHDGLVPDDLLSAYRAPEESP